MIRALSSAVLTLPSFLLKVMEKAKLRTIFSGFIVTILLGLSYSPAFWLKKKNLVIAGKLGPEPEILANMYKLLIERKYQYDCDC